jgi:hypothetical protein
VDGIDSARSGDVLKAEVGRNVDWRLRQWGASKAEVFAAEPLDLKAGDRIQSTRNGREFDRINGGRGTVTAIEAQSRVATVGGPRGQTQALSLDHTRDQQVPKRSTRLPTSERAGVG